MSLLQKMFGKRQKRTHPYCAALIAAAGSSTRYGGENKLLQTLDGIPVLVRTLLTIDRVEGIDEIVIAAREDELLPYAELCKTFGLRKPVKVIVGGATRTESVLRAALEASPETEFFAVQDGACPLRFQRPDEGRCHHQREPHQRSTAHHPEAGQRWR